jgi:hypothetical protein
MKNIVTLLAIILLFVAAGIFLLTGKLVSSDVKRAERLAAAGNCDKAVSTYAGAVVAMTESRVVPYVPDRAQAMNLNPQTWQKPIAEFVEWAASYKAMPPKLASALDAMDRCTTSVTHENTFYCVRMKKATQAEYTAMWQDSLCPEKASGGTVTAPAIEKAFSSGLSFMSIVGNPKYSYTVHLINRESGKQINATIECDKVSSFPIKPGRYTVVVSSKAFFTGDRFQGGKAWLSGKEALALVIPDTATAVTAYLKTEVKRPN